MEYSNITKDNVKFITLAEYGAMGASGEIELLSLSDNKFTLYSGNMCYGKKIMDMNEFHQVFSELNNISCFHEECRGLPDNWKYVYLGFGNYLFVSSDIYDYFKTLIDYVPRKTQYPYQTWKTCAVITLALLEKGLIDNNILGTMKESHLEQYSDDDWQNYIDFINKFDKDYEEISLNKKENANYVESDKQKPSIKSQFISFLIYMVIYTLICILCIMYVLYIK